MRLFPLFALFAFLTLTGCHSRHIEATVSNRTPEPLSLLEVDYPSASFGTQILAPGADFHYRIKVLGSGPTSVQWTDATRHDHKSSGPALNESDEGSLTVTFNPAGPAWNLHLLHP